jgi:hypothetical protein
MWLSGDVFLFLIPTKVFSLKEQLYNESFASKGAMQSNWVKGMKKQN